MRDVGDWTIERFPKAGNTSLNLIDRAIAAIVKSCSSLDFGAWILGFGICNFFWSLEFGVWNFHASGEIALRRTPGGWFKGVHRRQKNFGGDY